MLLLPLIALLARIAASGEAIAAGTLVVAKGDVMPEFVTLSGKGASSFQQRCPVIDNRFACVVPAGEYDLQLHARAHVSRFDFGVALKPGVRFEYGEVALHRGASIIGRVELALKGAKTENIQVIAAPLKGEQQAMTAPADGRGFFHLDGIAPGEYRVFARKAGLVSSIATIRVIEETQAELRRPVVLSKAQPVVIATMPSRDPWNHPWRVVLRDSDSHEEVASAATDEHGEAAFPAVRAGSYEVTIGPTGEADWFRDPVEVADRPLTLTLPVLASPIRGTLRLGDAPVRGKVIFGGRNGAIRVTMHAGDDGAFSGYLPPRNGATWEVFVDGQSPSVAQTVTARVRETGAGSRVDITLAATHITGRVVDEAGNGLSALLSASKGDESSTEQLRVDASGDFVFAGLPPGDYRLQADAVLHEAAGSVIPAQSEPVQLSLEKDLTDVVLRVRPRRRLRAQINGPFGPIAGATVAAFPTDAQAVVLTGATSDEHGHVDIFLPSSTNEIDLAVYAPGFASKIRHVGLPSEPVGIPVNQNGGALRVALPSDGNSWLQMSIAHRGALIPIMSFLTAAEPPAAEGDHFVVVAPMMEPGDYRLCRVAWTARAALPSARCSATTLIAGGEASLALP